jgi:hypothetical protein
MRTARLVALALSVTLASGCSWLTRKDDETTPEKLFTDRPCSTECCCKSKRGYYAYFRCAERAECERQGGTCLRADTARCAGEAPEAPDTGGDDREDDRENEAGE